MAIVINGSGTVTGLAVGGLPDGTVDEGTLATDSVTTTKIPAALENTFVSGRKNIIINGAMNVDQRNAGSSITPTSDNTVSLDRFKCRLSAASKYSVQQVSDAPSGFVKSLKVTSLAATTVGASDYYQVVSPIEGYDAQPLDLGASTAKTFTLSFWVKSSLTGTFGGCLSNHSGDRWYGFSYSISSANTWEKKSITVVGDTTGTYDKSTSGGLWLYWTLGAGSSIVASAGSWGSSFYRGITSNTNVVATNAATWQMTGVQLELGSTATDFEHRSYGEELALCQRYYEKFGNPDGVSGNVFFGITSATSATSARGPRIDFKVTKRATPTIALTGSLYYLSGPAWQSTAGWETTTQFIFGSQTTTGGVAGTAYTLSTTSGAGNYITADAEL